MILLLCLTIILLVALTLLAVQDHKKKWQPTREDIKEELRDECRCVLPEQSCPYCRKLAEMIEEDEQPKITYNTPRVINLEK